MYLQKHVALSNHHEIAMPTNHDSSIKFYWQTFPLLLERF